MWNWGIVYVMGILVVAVGAIAGMQSYGRREIAVELEETQRRLDALLSSRRAAAVEASTVRQQVDERLAELESERKARAEAEARASAALERIGKLEEQRHQSTQEAVAADAALRREEKLRAEAEDRLRHALEGLANVKVELEVLKSRRRGAGVGPPGGLEAPSGADAPRGEEIGSGAGPAASAGVEGAKAGGARPADHTAPPPTTVQAVPAAPDAAPSKGHGAPGTSGDKSLGGEEASSTERDGPDGGGVEKPIVEPRAGNAATSPGSSSTPAAGQGVGTSRAEDAGAKDSDVRDKTTARKPRHDRAPNRAAEKVRKRPLSRSASEARRQERVPDKPPGAIFRPY